MSLLFDETNDYLAIADHAALALPDADWAIGGWVRRPDPSGSWFDAILSWGALWAAPSLNWYVRESGNATDPNNLYVALKDADGTAAGFSSTGQPGTSTAWMHLLLQRSGSSFQQYVNGQLDGSAAVGDVDAIDRSGAMILGAEAALASGWWFGGYLAEWAKWDRALGADEIAALVAGLAPAFCPRGLAWYLPMLGGAVERVAGLSVTNNGAAVAEHPPKISYPPSGRRCAAASGGVRPASVFRSPVVA